MCFSPNTKVKTQRGDIAIVELVPGQDQVLTARGTWCHIKYVSTRKWNNIMLNMGDGELVTLTHLFLSDGGWIPACKAHPAYPMAEYEGTIHNIEVVCDETDDGTSPDTEHSYTLANGNVVHNIQT